MPTRLRFDMVELCVEYNRWHNWYRRMSFGQYLCAFQGSQWDALKDETDNLHAFIKAFNEINNTKYGEL